MEWNDWVNKIVFIKLTDGQFFSYSKVLLYEEPFISITDKFGYPAIINVNSIMKIKEEEDGRPTNR